MRVQGRYFGGVSAILAVALLAELCTLQAAYAQPVPSPIAIEFAAPTTYTPGQPVEIIVTLLNESDDLITAIGLVSTIPDDWIYDGMRQVSGALPAVAPAIGSTQRIEFAWINMPTFPYSFVLLFQVPEHAHGTATLQAQVESRSSAGRTVSAPATAMIEPVSDEEEVGPIRGFLERIFEWITTFLRELFGVFFS